MGFGFFGGCSRGKHPLRRLIEGNSHLIKDRLVVACGVGLPASVVLEVSCSTFEAVRAPMTGPIV
jgi:hypothetical protein